MSILQKRSGILIFFLFLNFICCYLYCVVGVFADFGARNQRFPMKEINVLEQGNGNEAYGNDGGVKDSGY